MLAQQHEGPLLVQKALHPEGPEISQVIVVHPPGGIAGGDELAMSLELEPGSQALVTTPGATRWYKAAGRAATQQITVQVHDAALEWLPQETIVFDAAQARMDTVIALRGRARYLGWEILCLGRTASGEQFGTGRVQAHTRLEHDGTLLWHERSVLTGGDALLQSPLGLQGRTVSATLLFGGESVSESTLATCRAVVPDEQGARAGLTALPGVLVGRYLGHSGEAARRYLAAVWSILRPAHFARAAVPPRIWST